MNMAIKNYCVRERVGERVRERADGCQQYCLEAGENDKACDDVMEISISR